MWKVDCFLLCVFFLSSSEGTTGMFSDGDPDSRPASAHGEDDLLAAIVRKRRLRIQPESTYV